MIKPSDVKIDKAANQHHIAMLEEQADRSIRSAHVDSIWPATVRALRMTIDVRAVEAVADKYRSAGWVIGSAPGCYFTIDHPERNL